MHARACGPTRATPGRERRRHGAGERLVHDARRATLDRPVRFAVLADYGSGNDDEWAVGRVLAAQRPEFAVTAGDNSYLVAAEPLLDRNIFRPLADLMRQRAAVRLPRRSRQLLSPARARSAARSTCPRAGASWCATGRSRSSCSATSPTSRTRSRSPARRCARAGPGRALRRLPPPAAGRRRDPARAARRRRGRLFCGPSAPLRAPHRRRRADVHRGHRRPGPVARAHEGTPGPPSACSTSAR